MLDFQDILDKSHIQDDFNLSPDTQALALSCLASFMGRWQWLYNEQEPTDSQWNQIEAAIALATLELSIPVVLGGGMSDYTLHNTIVLPSDATTYTLTDLHLLDGEDLLIELIIATTNASVRDLRVQINGLTTSIYLWRQSLIGGTQNIFAGTDTYSRIRSIIEPSATPQNYWSYLRINVPDYKATSRYPIIYTDGARQQVLNSHVCHVQSLTNVQTMTFFLDTSDIKVGTEIKIYTRG